MARTRTRRRPGRTASSSPVVMVPPVRVPVTTVPAPGATKDRSTHRRGRPASLAGGVRASIRSRAATKSSMPVPEMLSVATISAPARNVPAKWSETSRRAISANSSSTRSTLVSTTSPLSMPSSSRMRRCSSDCGFQPSVAATTKMQASVAPTPASMFLMNLMCPGTSTIAQRRPLGSSAAANPRSIVRPRRRSSSKRSGSVPVSALTSVDLPWST